MNKSFQIQITIILCLYLGIIFAQNIKNEIEGEGNISKSLINTLNRAPGSIGFKPKFSKLSELSGIVRSKSIGIHSKDLGGVIVEVKENDKILIENCTTDSTGYFELKNLEYNKFYTAYFSKDGYYTRTLRIYTYYVPDTLKQKKYAGKYGEWLINIIIPLQKVIQNNVSNPYDKDYAVLMYKPIEFLELKADDSLLVRTLSKYLDDNNNYSLIKNGGIVEDINYKKINEKWENEQAIDRTKETQKKSELIIQDTQLKLLIQELEKEKVVKEKLLLSNANKIKESELAKQKVIALMKQKELDLTNQKQKNINIEQRRKEATHKAELKQNSIILASVIAFLIFTIIFLGFIFRAFKNAKKQRDFIELKEKETQKQKQLIEEKNKEILDSIEYALRIQTAILPPSRIVKQYLENSFILYKPKDIVAGDFYWMETLNDLVLFAACDCTGHGVPGAMVSVVCHNALNRAVREFGLWQPAAILDKTAEIVLENFSKSEEEIQDGMDISICALNTKTKTLQWAGANNSLFLITNGHLTETKADKQCIGYNDNVKPFTNHQFKLQSDTSIYLFTDGFADQFGGQRERKLTRNGFRVLLLSIQHLPIQQQATELDKFITNYKQAIEQTDDILVIGVSV